MDDAFLTELLLMSAGKDATSVTHYRPFYCAARWLEQNRAAQQLSEAKGVKFTGLVTPIASLYGLQADYDSANELQIPKGFEAVATATTQPHRRFGTQSLVTKARP